MKWLFLVVGVVVGLSVIVFVIGALLPQNHLASRSTRLHRSPQTVWEAISNYRDFPSWRSNVASVQSLPEQNGLTSWRETAKDGQQIPYVILESVPQQRLVTKIADPKLPFGGSWTYELKPMADGTELRITENGEVYNPFFRFMSRFVFGHSSTIELYLAALGTKFQESVEIKK